MTTMNDAIIQLLGRWPCCTLATVAVSGLPQRERSFFVSFMPEARTAIALGHHVTTEEEWAWYATMDGSEHCAADDHCLEVCQAVKAVLIQFGHDAKIVSYPGRSGLQFRYVAQSAGLGDIGTNAFLFHPQWGPWIHLRVMATTVELDFCTQISGI
jgi:epoxyqueuosine reductase